MTTIALSLISHTNVGKTTLARTLLRRDIGEVLDQAHVTEVSEANPLVETDDARLVLWDTPGLGDSARLVRRLRQEGNPLGWLLHQVWDRARDRPLYSSQEAVRNIQSDADVVLYLVNAAEDPTHAGYVPWEMELLGWLGKPVIALLNQAGGAPAEPWRARLADCAIVRAVLPLDAFARCWVQEGVLLERVVDVLPEEKRAAMRRLAAAWQERNLAVFCASVERIAAYLERAAADREPLPEEAARAVKRRAMRALADRLDGATRALMDELIELHGLRGRHQVEARTRIEEDFELPGEAAWNSGVATVLGAAMGGAAGGLAADVLSGGLTFGAGAVAGAILGAAGAVGLRKGYELALAAEGPPRVAWSAEFLRDLVEQTLQRYLALAHFGRGRGEWPESEPAAQPGMRAMLETVLVRRRDDLSRALETVVARELATAPSGAASAVAGAVERILGETLTTAYPEAVRLFGDSTFRRKGS